MAEPPTPEEIAAAPARSGSLPLRGLCRALWPGVPWRQARSAQLDWPEEQRATCAEWLAAQAPIPTQASPPAQPRPGADPKGRRSAG